MIVEGGIAGDVNHAIKPRLSVTIAGGLTRKVNHVSKQSGRACSALPSAPNWLQAEPPTASPELRRSARWHHMRTPVGTATRGPSLADASGLGRDSSGERARAVPKDVSGRSAGWRVLICDNNLAILLLSRQLPVSHGMLSRPPPERPDPRWSAAPALSRHRQCRECWPARSCRNGSWAGAAPPAPP